MFNTTVVRNSNSFKGGDHTVRVTGAPNVASGVIVKNHPFSRIELCSKGSYILSDGYTKQVYKGWSNTGEKIYEFHKDDKCTVLQVMPYTADLLLVEYILDKEIIEEEERC